MLPPDGRSLNQELVTAGLAWWFRKYSQDLRLGELERQAREAKLGLWAEPHPVPPWESRKRNGLVMVPNEEEAEAAGYRMAGNCR